MISADEALRIVLENVAPLGIERVPLLAAHGRVLAEDVIAAMRRIERHILRRHRRELGQPVEQALPRFLDRDHGASKLPDLPPLLCTSRMSVMRMPRSTALHMS